jgi:FAD/FMN-containing dehydrogenase
MEHPLRVDEYIPSAALAVVHDEPVAVSTPATPLPPLPSLPASDALLLRPNDANYAKYLPSINLRKQLRPALRAVCKTEHAVAVMVDWVRTNNLKFAVRCGGHSYEGFSQSTDVVIDVRGLKQIVADKPNGVVTAGSGVSLYELYRAVAAQGLAVQAGSCPTVGLSGHLTGGGHGLLARSHGLTCDTLQQVTVIDSQAYTRQASATSEPDLFWACRGGGGGSFGVATEFKIGVFPLATVRVFGVSWILSPSHAARLFTAWQAWAPNAPRTITPIMKVGPSGNGKVKLRCIGQSIGTEAELRSQLAPLVALDTPSSALSIRSMSFMDGINWFGGVTAGQPVEYASVYMKAKSDYVLSPLGTTAIQAMMAAAAAGSGVVMLCDAYGGKIADTAADASAFPRRAGTQFCIQYYAEWLKASDSPGRIAQVNNLYAAMRPHVPGASYVNYCDLDLPDYATAYWGSNLARLSAVKRQYDPDNLFHHAQSVPLPPAAPPVA